MIGLIQRVSRARVETGGRTVADIQGGITALIGVEKPDTTAQAERLLERILTYRIFPDTSGRMNRSLSDTGGGLLLVPQFTLAADTRKGTRPSFSPAAPPGQGEELFLYLVARARQAHAEVGAGVFGADMQVSLTNDGPVTFWLRV